MKSYTFHSIIYIYFRVFQWCVVRLSLNTVSIMFSHRIKFHIEWNVIDLMAGAMAQDLSTHKFNLNPFMQILVIKFLYDAYTSYTDVSNELMLYHRK